MRKRHWNTPETEGMTDREYARWVTDKMRRERAVDPRPGAGCYTMDPTRAAMLGRAAA